MQCAQHTSDHRNTNTVLLIFNPANQDLRGSLGRMRYASPALTRLKTTLAFKTEDWQLSVGLCVALLIAILSAVPFSASCGTDSLIE